MYRSEPDESRIIHQQLTGYYDEIQSERGYEATPEEREIAMKLIEILYSTELPEFSIIEITRTLNDTALPKWNIIQQIPEIADSILPDYQLVADPLSFDRKVLEQAAWVNIIHATMKVLNELNTIRAMQISEIEISPEVIASSAHSLYNFTTNADVDPFVRSEISYAQRRPFAETIRRKNGTKGVNPGRHVCMGEMRHILETINAGFAKT